jgi:hypothetical protein
VGSLEPYETEPGAATRLDGTKAPVQGLSVAEALRLHPQEAVYVRGYLLAPYDDKPRLCTRLSETGKCDGALVLDLSGVDLEVGDTLRAGCCSLGLWSPRPLVVRVKLGSGRRARVIG